MHKHAERRLGVVNWAWRHKCGARMPLGVPKASQFNKVQTHINKLGPLAQSVEQRTFNPWVVGSSPTGPTYFLIA